MCDEGWDRNSSLVACRNSLGFETDQAIPIRGGYFGNVSPNRPIHVSQTECGRGDDVLVSCSSFELSSCTHSQDAGVFCYG